MSVALVVAAVVGVIALIAAVQWLFYTHSLQVELPARPLAAVRARTRPSRPLELANLETLVADALNGDRAAAGRLAAALRSIGVPINEAASPLDVIAALRALPNGDTD